MTNLFFLTIYNLKEENKLIIQEMMSVATITYLLQVLMGLGQDIIVFITFISNVPNNLFNGLFDGFM